MKLRVTVDGKPYDVSVEVLEPAAPSAIKPPPPPPSVITAPPAPARVEPQDTTPAIVEDVSISIAGTITQIRAKVGDAVRPHDTIMSFAASSAITGGDSKGNGLSGAVHAPSAGTITEILVKTGDKITPNQPLARVRVRRSTTS